MHNDSLGHGCYNQSMSRIAESGLGFGLTSGVITTLGLLVGTAASTSNPGLVAGSILTIALADSMSDAFGMHVSAESTNASERSTWVVTFTTFGTKLATTLTFLIPILLFPLSVAVWICVLWGCALLIGLSSFIARQRGVHIMKPVIEHVGLALVVVYLSQILGNNIVNLVR